ncbi:uncharacterized protein TRUGW13939_00330 [Talaromyces rugulosus]|uniref:Cell cycle inhibitor Nif1 n=1 Tax=Talaromyces rugulosus TaxID=121627 RepID=A0A7H8QH32_TALRU|nr:uncharacterized protein TRUGW13939_00330 [Talaromyces rugulosus]QKX53254.1 hypothetical protein TRUGW13939_00330 [Talaromyces rugulosus]
MNSRPDYLDFHGDGTRSARASPSPRIEHFDGEIPPALSPLDAFAAQGRLLARQLDESMRRDRRMSRLPPQSVARSLSQPRPGYFRSPGSDSSQRVHRPTESPDLVVNHIFEDPKYRPQSQHPRISGLSILHSETGFDDDFSQPPMPQDDESERVLPATCYEAPRVESPEPVVALQRDYSDSSSNLPTPQSNSHNSPSVSAGSSMDSNHPQISTTLAPPVSPMPQSFYNPKYMQPENSDDDYTSSNTGSTFSKARQFSAGSGISMPYSPMSPHVRSHPRSPSVSSEASNYLPRPSFNFSRPLSRSSTSLSAPSPVMPQEAPTSNQTPSTAHPTSGRQSSTGIHRENKPAPIVLEEGIMASFDEEPPSSAVSSYVYAKYSLPRGRSVMRNSIVFAGLQTPHFEWQEPLFESPPSKTAGDRTPSPGAAPKETPVQAPEAKSKQLKPPSGEAIPTIVDPLDTVPSTPTRQSYEIPRETRPSFELPPNHLQRSRSEHHLDDSKSSSADSASTIRPLTARTTATQATDSEQSTEQSVEEHVDKGIECHEKGALQESTYHLRIAAKQNHPIGMLLYALACRHGWGMRPNQREGVQWLRKAVDSAGLEVGEDDEAVGGKDAAARKARRAQFALGIYELGVSHLNGWGIEQDKALALRCFEIAARWGDADALAEAGFCYAQGVGCKKDLKKAARYYRQAEAKGMSMVGNSWIYKDKYMADDDDSRQSRQSRSRQGGASEKKPRSKSRTRSIFGRKKSLAA